MAAYNPISMAALCKVWVILEQALAARLENGLNAEISAFEL